MIARLLTLALLALLLATARTLAAAPTVAPLWQTRAESLWWVEGWPSTDCAGPWPLTVARGHAVIRCAPAGPGRERLAITLTGRCRSADWAGGPLERQPCAWMPLVGLHPGATMALARPPVTESL